MDESYATFFNLSADEKAALKLRVALIHMENAKPNNGSEKDHFFEVAITALEKVITYYNSCVIRGENMYIVNEHGVVHSIPDEWKLPAKARKATKEEIAAYDAASPVAVAAVAGPSLEAVNTIAERDAEIAKLRAELEKSKAKK